MTKLVTEPLVVLVVDDEEEVRLLERRILEKAGCQVVEAAHGAAAIDVLERGPRIDVVVADVEMPELAGDEMARRIQATRPGLKVLFVTGRVDRLFDGQGPLSDGRAFLRKPFTAAGLIEALSLLLYDTTDFKSRHPQ